MSDGTTHLLRSGLAGNAVDLECFVSRVSPLLLAVARRCLRAIEGRGVESEDVVQDIWLRCLPRLGSIQPRDGRITPPLVKSLLSEAVHRRARDLLAMAARHGRVILATESVGELPEATVGVVTRVVVRERGERVLRAIEALDLIDRDVLVMLSIEQLPIAQVALVLSISADAVRQRHHRARERLRAELPDSLFVELD